jgi:hydroxyacylglutathione hydrolase
MLGAVPSSTVGYERLFSWWGRYLGRDDEEGFVEALLEGQPDAPIYFGRMKRQNRFGPALLGERSSLAHYKPGELQEKLRDGKILLVDTRSYEAYLESTVPGALYVPGEQSFATWAPWAIDPEKQDRSIVVLARDEADASELRDKLARVSIDDVAGYATSLEGIEKEPVQTIAPEMLKDAEDVFVLDVREKGEYEAGHIPGARQLHGGRVMWHFEELPHDGTIVVHCQTGTRSAVIASALRAAGFDNVVELEGGYEGWVKAKSGWPRLRA